MLAPVVIASEQIGQLARSVVGVSEDGARQSDHQQALRWAVSVRHPVAMPVVHRRRAGGPGFDGDELAAVVADWEEAGRPPPEVHIHRTPVTFEDGTTITGVTFTDQDPYVRDTAPAFGLYLDEKWGPPWTHAHVDWPDFGVPPDIDALRRDLAALLERARGGEAVELGCWGGHGRTGTAIGCLAVMTGTPAADAVDWVRAHYCDRAIETPEQEAFVRSFTG
jgi:hypothetical protein